MNAQSRNPRLSYRAAAVAGASPVRLVTLLYEQLIEDLQRAASALRARNIGERTRQINHAILVVGYLQASLDKDRGAPVAATLERFYEQLRAGLMEAQFRQSVAILEQQICDLMQVHEAWREVERATMAGAGFEQAATYAEAPSPQRDQPMQSSGGWNA
jgi:flagellar secretion chaperone FliS